MQIFTLLTPIKVHSATHELLIQGLLDGQELKRVTLPAAKNDYPPDPRGWQPGLYVATLVVGGKARQHRRFVVNQ